MDTFLFLSILLSISALAKADHPNVTDDSESGGSFPHAAVSSSVGSLIFILLLICLVYYCCYQNRTPEGFTQFNNENERNPPTGQSRWRNRRFFRRNRRPNQHRSNAEAHVTISPVINFGIPSGDQNSGVAVPMPPPAYDESMNNQQIPNQFMNPQMPNPFINPPMSSQCMNPPMSNNFNNPPMFGNFNNQNMPRNIEPSKNSNASVYNPKY